MRDSPLKRFLVAGLFSARELWTGLRGVHGQPACELAAPDYDAYWRSRGPGAVQPRFEIIARHLEAGTTLLDVGCGDGAMLEYLAATKQIRGVGLDISAVAIAMARRRGVEAYVGTLAGLHRQRPSSCFQHAVMSEVLEHVADPETLLLQGWDLTSETLWLTFPNIAYFPHRLRLLAGKFPVQWTVFPGEHLRFWSLPDFRHWLLRLGMPRPRFYPSNGIVLFGLHRGWPNLLANQIVARVDKP